MMHPHNNGHGLFRIPAHFFKILKSLSMDFQDTLSRLSFHSKDMITTTLISLKRYFPKQCETSHLAWFACLLHARRLLCEPRIAWPLRAMGFIGRKRARDDATHGDMPSSTHLGNWLLTQVAWGGSVPINASRFVNSYRWIFKKLELLPRKRSPSLLL